MVPSPIRVLLVFAILHLIALSSHTIAQEPEANPLRYEVTPFVGYRSSVSFPVDPQVTGMNPRVVVDASPSYGLTFGFRMRARDEDLIEVRWARQDSYVHTEDISPAPPRQRIVLDQFHGDFSHEPFIEQWPSWARAFVIASIGATHISADSNFSFTRFSFGIGGGIRLYPSRHVGFKIQAEWLPIFADPHVAFVCGGGCIVHVGGTVASQGEIIAGPIFRF